MDAPAHQVAPTKLPITTKKSPYCNERGLIEYVRVYDGKVRYMPCDHNPATIKGEALKREAEIGTIQKGCKQPVVFYKKEDEADTSGAGKKGLAACRRIPLSHCFVSHL